MISWDSYVRCSPGLTFSVSSVKRRLKFKKLTAIGTFAVALPSNPENILDIYNLGELQFNVYGNCMADIHIIGLAESREAACELASEIIAEVYGKTGSVTVRDFYRENK